MYIHYNLPTHDLFSFINSIFGRSTCNSNFITTGTSMFNCCCDFRITLLNAEGNVNFAQLQFENDGHAGIIP